MNECKTCEDRKKVIDTIWKFKCSSCKSSFEKQELNEQFQLQQENERLKETIVKLKKMINYILVENKTSNKILENMTEPIEVIINSKNKKQI